MLEKNNSLTFGNIAYKYKFHKFLYPVVKFLNLKF